MSYRAPFGSFLTLSCLTGKQKADSEAEEESPIADHPFHPPFLVFSLDTDKKLLPTPAHKHKKSLSLKGAHTTSWFLVLNTAHVR
jgi:hypothetical protein